MEKDKGLIHVYFGNGKGKTTAAMGLCARAAGYGYRVLIYQFMKDNKTSERNILKLSENITLLPGLEKEKFSAYLTEEERRERKIFYADQFERMTKQAEGYDVLFMDEIIYAIQAELLEEDKIIEYLKRKPKHLEIILDVYKRQMYTRLRRTICTEHLVFNRWGKGMNCPKCNSPNQEEFCKNCKK